MEILVKKSSTDEYFPIFSYIYNEICRAESVTLKMYNNKDYLLFECKLVITVIIPYKEINFKGVGFPLSVESNNIAVVGYIDIPDWIKIKLPIRGPEQISANGITLVNTKLDSDVCVNVYGELRFPF